MVRFYRIAAVAIFTTLLGIGIVLDAQQRGAATTAANVTSNLTGIVTNDVLRRAGTASESMPGTWLSYGRTQSETRYSPLNLIDSTNVKRLGLAWSYVMGAGGGNQEGTPLMWNNTLIRAFSERNSNRQVFRSGMIRRDPSHAALRSL